jgi:hypothetical protein
MTKKKYTTEQRRAWAAKDYKKRKAHCNKVSSEYGKKWHIAWKALLHDKGMDKCSKCGYDKCWSAIEFHHLNPADKSVTPARMFRKAITEERLAELNKCIPLCANCHREIHSNGHL